MILLFQIRFMVILLIFFLSFEVKSNQEIPTEEDKKRDDCITKYVNENLKNGEKQIIHRACERLVSKNERKQKIAKCTLKEIGKHSLTVLIVKQNNCFHHFMYHKYE